MNKKKALAETQAALNAFNAGQADIAWQKLQNLEQKGLATDLGYFLLGAISFNRQQYPASQQYFQHAVRIKPDYIQAWNNLGLARQMSSDLEGALKAFEKAIAIKPDYPDALISAGSLAKTLGQSEKAFSYLTRGLKLAPDNRTGLNNLGQYYLELAQYHDSLPLLEKAVALKPDDTGIMNNLAYNYAALGQFSAAWEVFDKVLALRPDFAEALNNYAMARQAHGENDAAAELFRRSLQASPGYMEAHSNYSYLLLLTGHYRDGWDHYRYRASARLYPMRQTVFPADMSSKKILLLKDQGLGDELFFLRFAPLLASRGARIDYLTDPRLVPLINRASGLDHVLDIMPDQSQYDEVLSIGDLPFCLQTHETPPPVALPVSIALTETNEQLLASAGNRKLLGLTWRAGTPGFNRFFKQIGLDLLLPQIPDEYQVISLQRAPQPAETELLQETLGERFTDLSHLNSDLPQMLALLNRIDSYVCVSNTNTHLLAGLGKTAHMLVPHPPEWRWGSPERGSDWFPAMPQYRQNPDGDWTDALEQLGNSLKTITTTTA